MGSEKRQRQRENRMRAIAEAERAKKRSTTGRKVFRAVLVVTAVLIALWLWSTFSGGDDDESSDEASVATDAPDAAAFETAEPTDQTTSDAEPSGSEEPAVDTAPDDSSPQAATPDDSSPQAATGGPAPHRCPAEDGSDGHWNQLSQAPPVCIDTGSLYAAAVDTNQGSFTLVLDPALDPVSVNNFIVLARWGAYDGTLFHRVIEDFMIQGGDVQLQFGTGGPGYQFTGGFPDENWYRAGSLAMANRGNPATNGAQFFIITGPSGIGLPALYSPMGQVIDGLDIVCSIEGAATDPRDAPVDEVVVHSVTITEASDAQARDYSEALDGDRFVDGC